MRSFFEMFRDPVLQRAARRVFHILKQVPHRLSCAHTNGVKLVALSGDGLFQHFALTALNQTDHVTLVKNQRHGPKVRASQRQKAKHPPENTTCPPSFKQTYGINPVSRCIVHRRDSERGTYTSATRTKANLRLREAKKTIGKESKQLHAALEKKRKCFHVPENLDLGAGAGPCATWQSHWKSLSSKYYLLRQAQMVLSAHPVFMTIHVHRRLFPILLPVALTRINQQLSPEARWQTALTARAAAAPPDHAVKHFPSEERRSSLTSRKILV